MSLRSIWDRVMAAAGFAPADRDHLAGVRAASEEPASRHDPEAVRRFFVTASTEALEIAQAVIEDILRLRRMGVRDPALIAAAERQTEDDD